MRKQMIPVAPIFVEFLSKIKNDNVYLRTMKKCCGNVRMMFEIIRLNTSFFDQI